MNDISHTLRTSVQWSTQSKRFQSQIIRLGAYALDKIEQLENTSDHTYHKAPPAKVNADPTYIGSLKMLNGKASTFWSKRKEESTMGESAKAKKHTSSSKIPK